MIGIDTTAIIDLFKGEEGVRSVLTNVHEPLVTTQLNYLEIFWGIDRTNTKHQKEIEYYDAFFDELKTIALDNYGCKKAAELFWKLRKDGKNIGKFDCIIAALLLSQGVNAIITRNVAEFERAGMRVIKY